MIEIKLTLDGTEKPEVLNGVIAAVAALHAAQGGNQVVTGTLESTETPVKPITEEKAETKTRTRRTRKEIEEAKQAELNAAIKAENEAEDNDLDSAFGFDIDDGGDDDGETADKIDVNSDEFKKEFADLIRDINGMKNGKQKLQKLLEKHGIKSLKNVDDDVILKFYDDVKALKK